jgi:uncharacterized membrane protein (DUF373 family)
MENILSKFEKVITYILLITSMVVISYQVIQLILEMVIILWDKITVNSLVYDPKNTGNFAVLFFSVLLSLEVMETIRLFYQSHEVKIRLIFIVSMIAISRKLLALSSMPGKASYIDYLTTAGLILAFAIGYYLIRKVGAKDSEQRISSIHKTIDETKESE